MPKSNSRSSTPTNVRKRTLTTTTSSSTTPPLTSSSSTTPTPTSSSKQNKDKDDDIKSKNATITSSSSSSSTSSLFTLKCSGGSLILFIFLTILINIGWFYAFTTLKNSGKIIIEDLKNSGKIIIEDLNERLDQYDIDLKEANDSNQLLEIRSNTLQSQLKEAIHNNRVLEGRFQGLENMLNDSKDFQSALEAEKADMIKEKIEYIRQLEMYRGELNKMENKFTECTNTLKNADSKNNEFDKDLDNLDIGPDDEQDQVYEWFAAFFNYQDAGIDNSTSRDKKTVKDCPFQNPEDTLSQFKLNKKWIELQRSSINSDARKQIIKELSLQFHPDKMKLHGCPPNFGDRVMAILNEKRELKRNRKH